MPRRLGVSTGGASGSQSAGSAESSKQELDLPERVLRDWAKGLLSSAQVQDYCRGAVVSGSDAASVGRLAELD